MLICNTNLQKLSVCKVERVWHFLLTLHISHLSAFSDSLRRNISNIDQSEKSWKKCEKNLLRQNSQTKEVKCIDLRHAFRIKITKKRMQVSKFVSVQAAGPKDYQCPLQYGTFAAGMEFLLKAGEDQFHTKSMTCSLLYTFSSQPPISWAMVVPGHLPGSNGPSL